MAIPIRMPMPGQMTEECTVLQWYKAEGDTVSKGDPLFEIETDKSNMEIEAFDEGTLLRIDAAEGATVPVEAIVAWIGQPGEELPEPVAAGAGATADTPPPPAETPSAPAPSAPATPPMQARADAAAAVALPGAGSRHGHRRAASSRSARVPVASLPSSGSTRAR